MKMHIQAIACISTVFALMVCTSCTATGESSSSLAKTSSTSTASVSSVEISSSTESSEDVASSQIQPPSSAKPAASSKKPPNSSTSAIGSQASTENKSNSNNSTNVDLSGMVYENGSYYDKTKPTFTQADIGMVVGYNPASKRDIVVVVVKVDETPTKDGRKCVRLYLGYRGDEVGLYSPPGFCKVECSYCHAFPCPEDGGTNCPKYDPLKDPSVTCQRCGKPCGNGYYGTCQGIINWYDPTKPFITCHSYSNCLKCGKPVGDGYNGTCHVTWGQYAGVTTCNYYD